jgi:hypothetical protein
MPNEQKDAAIKVEGGTSKPKRNNNRRKKPNNNNNKPDQNANKEA